MNFITTYQDNFVCDFEFHKCKTVEIKNKKAYQQNLLEKIGCVLFAPHEEFAERLTNKFQGKREPLPWGLHKVVLIIGYVAFFPLACIGIAFKKVGVCFNPQVPWKNNVYNKLKPIFEKVSKFKQIDVSSKNDFDIAYYSIVYGERPHSKLESLNQLFKKNILGNFDFYKPPTDENEDKLFKELFSIRNAWNAAYVTILKKCYESIDRYVNETFNIETISMDELRDALEVFNKISKSDKELFLEVANLKKLCEEQFAFDDDLARLTAQYNQVLTEV